MYLSIDNLYFSSETNIIYILGLIFSFYLIVATIFELFSSKNQLNFKQYLSKNLSHLGFGLLILSITLNSFFSKEYNFMINVNDKYVSDDLEITFEEFNISKEINFDQFSTISYLLSRNISYLIRKYLLKLLMN